MLDRQRQDFLTWAVALGILVSQATPWVPSNPPLLAVVAGILGIPTIRKVQDAVNGAAQDRKDKAPK